MSTKDCVLVTDANTGQHCGMALAALWAQQHQHTNTHTSRGGDKRHISPPFPQFPPPHSRHYTASNALQTSADAAAHKDETTAHAGAGSVKETTRRRSEHAPDPPNARLSLCRCGPRVPQPLTLPIPCLWSQRRRRRSRHRRLTHAPGQSPLELGYFHLLLNTLLARGVSNGLFAMLHVV